MAKSFAQKTIDCEGCVWFASGDSPYDGIWAAEQCQDCVRSTDLPDNYTPGGCLWVTDEWEEPA